jgi:LacI family gluconate utilization system Gnt-I transcriptional repressor
MKQVRPGRAGSHRPRLDEVARLAGVSPSTVSRVIRAPDLVAPETRAAVLAAIETLGYVRNSIAGGLAGARSQVVCVIVPAITNAFFAVAVDAMTDELAAGGLQVMLSNSHHHLAREEELVRSFLSWSPAGVVVTGRRHSRETSRMLLGVDAPVVEIWDAGESLIDSVVGFSHRAIGAAIGRRFLDAGVRRPASVGAHLQLDYRAAERIEGFVGAMAAAGLDVVRVATPDVASERGGFEAMARLADGGERPDAVFFSNDTLMLGALFACRQRGWSVPDQVRLCGFGDFPFTEAGVADLSTVRPPSAVLGRRVARVILDRLARPQSSPVNEDLGFDVLVRGSG